MITFVILNYLLKDITENCIEQIRKVCMDEQYHIVLVDNASPNGSGEQLYKEYNTSEDCTVILNSENVGFAKGNNIGWNYAKNHFSSDFIVVMNNDVMISDNAFCPKIKEIYSKTRFKVLGPDIFAVKRNIHQNPMKKEPYTYSEILKIKNDRERWLRHYNLHYYSNKIFYPLKKQLKYNLRKLSGSQSKPSSDLWKTELINPVLHGACLIFSRDFIDVCDEPFYPNTFLYFEEDILHYYCRKNNYLMVYSPSIQVVHLQNASTDIAFKGDYSKLKMQYSNLVKSTAIFLDLMDKDNQETNRGE